MFIHAAREATVGALQALIDELEFNLALARSFSTAEPAKFLDSGFEQAKREGFLSILIEALKVAIFDAYIAMRRVNLALDDRTAEGVRRVQTISPAPGLAHDAEFKIQKALDELMAFLGTEIRSGSRSE